MRDHHLPKGVTFDYGSYYYRGADRRRVNLGRHLPEALAHAGRLMLHGATRADFPSSSESFVYLIAGEAAAQPVKIGQSANPAARLAKLQTSTPVRLEILLTMQFASETEARAVEAAAHEQFAEQRVHGEWFDTPADVVAAWLKASFGNDVMVEPDFRFLREIPAK